MTDHNYRVQDDLNRESLPQTQRDPSRKIAWANAICATVLGVGVFFHSEVRRFEFHADMVEALPVVIPEFVPEVTPPPQQDIQDEDKTDQVTDAPVDPVVVAADPSKVNFAVTVNGPTVTATDFRYAPPPPRITQRPTSAPSGPTVFRGGSSTDGGSYPDAPYPRDALMRRETGEVQLYVVVAEDGTAEKVEVRISSGSPTLDRTSRAHVLKYWHWPAGPRREYLVPIEYIIR
jgi:TonB family protein